MEVKGGDLSTWNAGTVEQTEQQQVRPTTFPLRQLRTVRRRAFKNCRNAVKTPLQVFQLALDSQDTVHESTAMSKASDQSALTYPRISHLLYIIPHPRNLAR